VLLFCMLQQETALSACQDGPDAPPTQCTLAWQFSFSATETEHNMPGQQMLQCPVLLLNSEHAHADAHFALWWWLLHDGHASGSPISCTPDFFNGAGCTCEVEGQQLVPPGTLAPAGTVTSASHATKWTCDWPNGMSPAAAEAANVRMNVRIAAGVITPWVCVFLVWQLYR
jgi:hypothetical protein